MAKGKLSDSQRAALRNLAEGKDAGNGLRGRSAFGGLTGTLLSLYRAGLATLTTDGPAITDAGHAALAPATHKDRNA